MWVYKGNMVGFNKVGTLWFLLYVLFDFFPD